MGDKWRKITGVKSKMCPKCLSKILREKGERKDITDSF